MSAHRLRSTVNRLCMLLLAALSIHTAVAQQSELQFENRIVISIPDLQNQGGLEDSAVAQISEFLRTRFIQNSLFQVVERERVGDILIEQEFQDTGLTSQESAIEYGKLQNASQLLLGSAGELFGRVVISVRLVTVESGQIMLADTQFTPPESVFDAVTALAAQIADTAMDLNRVVDLRLIEERIQAREFSRARELLDLYVRRNGANDQVRDLLERIRPELYREYMNAANRARRNSDFALSRKQVGFAIALNPTVDAYTLRERIIREEQLFNERQQELHRLAEVRAVQQREAMLSDLQDAPIVSIEDYYSRIRVSGHRIGASTTWTYDSVPAVPSNLSSAGLAYLGVFSLLGSDGDLVAAVPVGYLSAHGVYIPREVADAAVLDLAFSPHLGMTFRLLNLFLVIGVDAGVRLEFSDSVDDGVFVNLTAGATATTELRFVDRFGVYASVRIAPRFPLDRFAVDAWDVYAASGLVFR